MQLKLPKQQHEQLSAVLRELNVQQSSKLPKGQLTLLPGLLLEQLYTEQPTQGRPHLTTLISQFTQGTMLHSLKLLACSSISSPLLLCIASLCDKTTFMCPSLAVISLRGINTQ